MLTGDNVLINDTVQIFKSRIIRMFNTGLNNCRNICRYKKNHRLSRPC